MMYLKNCSNSYQIAYHQPDTDIRRHSEHYRDRRKEQSGV